MNAQLQTEILDRITKLKPMEDAKRVLMRRLQAELEDLKKPYETALHEWCELNREIEGLESLLPAEVREQLNQTTKPAEPPF